MRPAFLLGLLFLAASLASPAEAKNTSKGRSPDKAPAQVWAIAKGEDAYVLRYGAAQSADPLFAAACQPSAELLQITLEVASTKIRSGDGVAVSLQAGRRRLELAATAFRGAREGHMVVEAAVMLEARVFDLFESGDDLVITLPGSREAIPLAGARPKIADFKRACLPQAR